MLENRNVLVFANDTDTLVEIVEIIQGSSHSTLDTHALAGPSSYSRQPIGACDTIVCDAEINIIDPGTNVVKLHGTLSVDVLYRQGRVFTALEEHVTMAWGFSEIITNGPNSTE